MRTTSGPIQVVRKAGALIGRRGHLNFIEGTNVTLTIIDDSANDEIDITVAASGGGTGHTIKESGTPFTARAGLNFLSGFDVVDDAAGDETEVSLDASEVAGAPTQIDIGDAVVTGALATFANADHQHAFPAPGVGYPVDADFTAEADGTATTPARSDHRHTLVAPVTGYPVDVAAAEADGTATNPARADHVHAHGSGYLANAHHAQAHDIDGADHTQAGGTAGRFFRETGAATFTFEAVGFARGGTILDPAGARTVMVWRAPFACTVTNVRGHRKGGTGATINARRNQASDHLAADLSLVTTDVWTDGGAVSNTAYAAGDDLEIALRSIAGSPTEIAIQVDFTRP